MLNYKRRRSVDLNNLEDYTIEQNKKSKAVQKLIMQSQ